MTKLFIDDERFPPDDGGDWLVVRTVAEAIAHMETNGCPPFVSFDHDLGADAGGDSIMLVHWMIERDLDMEGKFIPAEFTYYVHSQNPVGVLNIKGWLDGYLGQR